jgi:isopentenyl-diphosphate Delta-isomerase
LAEDREKQKLDQLETVLCGDVAPRHTSTGFESIRFVHNALPELDIDGIDLGAAFLGRTLRAPILISSMTGGPQRAADINSRLAEVAQDLKIAFAVGSQRIALETDLAGGFDKNLRKRAPDVPILANLGAAQIREVHGLDYARRAVEMIEADALIIHLNPLQEVLQAGGDRNWSGVVEKIGGVVAALHCPVVIKETGCGLSARAASRLKDAGVKILDIAGAGGTSWAAVVADRAPTKRARQTAETFRDWGIPTATSLVDVRSFYPDAEIIASGGMRNGLDAAKAIRLGADLVGFAGSILKETVDSAESLRDRFEAIIEELRISAFCTGSSSLNALRSAEIVRVVWDR